MSNLSQGTLAFTDPSDPPRTRWGSISKLATALLGDKAPQPVSLAQPAARWTAASPPKGASGFGDTSQIEITPEYELVLEAVNQGAPAIFVTGKAGTGKSTLIRFLIAKLQGCAVVAPTAIAALNVGGETIHSFFGLPPATVDPSEAVEVRPRTRSMLRALKVLIVDEVSMVTGNLIDRMDKTLRVARNREEPFGGVTVIFVGDLLQLPPVVASEEEAQFYAHRYGGVYFFLAAVFSQIEILPVALTQVRRQADLEFIEALSRIRSADNHREMVGFINRKCYLEPQESGRPNKGVYLVTTNAQASAINARELKLLTTEPRSYEAKTTGTVPLKNWKEPAPATLELKVGAKVLFVANNKPHWVNGDLGEIVELGQTMIRVRKLSDGSLQEVQPFVWERHRYAFRMESGRLERELVATYEQFPLTLGWAITIHKSQGMSLDEVTLDLGQGAFAQGQTYVALSRCRTIGGLKLVRPIGMKDVKVDPQLIEFYKDLGLH